jgi:hypothetical protein
MSAKFRRTRLWIDSAFQGRLLLRMCSYLLFYTLIVVHIGFVFELMASFASAPERSAQEYYADFLWQQRFLVLAFVLAAPVILYDLLKFSHRIAGPLYRCRNVMQQMAAGKPVPEFKPRKHDLMRELFQVFNALIQTCNARVASLDQPGEPAPEGPEIPGRSPGKEALVAAGR